jgi:hypothetical protein
MEEGEILEHKILERTAEGPSPLLSGQSAKHFTFLRFLEENLPLILQVAAGEFDDGSRGFQCAGGLFSISGFKRGLGLCYC